MTSDLWSVVLAAGSGRRLATMTRGTPKQFWRADDRPSLLEETFARLAPLSPPERTTVVVDRTHRCFVSAAGPAWRAGWLLFQPEDRGTAAGVMLALTPVLDQARDAIVIVTPSDHGVADPARFQASVREAAAAVRSGNVKGVLFGVEPSEPLTDYGWITPGREYRWAKDRPLRRVAAFVEKPTIDLACRLFATGALWNTMVLVASLEALLALYRTHLPYVAETFGAHQRLPSHERERFLASQYPDLPVADFSRDVLTPARGLAVHAWDQSIGWSDLGTPERLCQWLGKYRTRNDSPLQPLRRVTREGLVGAITAHGRVA